MACPVAGGQKAATVSRYSCARDACARICHALPEHGPEPGGHFQWGARDGDPDGCNIKPGPGIGKQADFKKTDIFRHICSENEFSFPAGRP